MLTKEIFLFEAQCWRLRAVLAAIRKPSLRQAICRAVHQRLARIKVKHESPLLPLRHLLPVPLLSASLLPPSEKRNSPAPTFDEKLSDQMFTCIASSQGRLPNIADRFVGAFTGR
jgi:hypothetical protein